MFGLVIRPLDHPRPEFFRVSFIQLGGLILEQLAQAVARKADLPEITPKSVTMSRPRHRSNQPAGCRPSI